MAFLYIWEFSETVVRDGTQIPKAPGIIQQTPVAITVGSLQSAKFNTATSFIYISADQICSIVIGTNPVATLNSFRIPQGEIIPWGVNPGDQIAVIANV
jgi:hypothetical protein